MRFGILGPVTLAADDGTPRPVGPTQRRAVLALLVAHAGRLVTVREIVDGVWGERPPSTAVKNVHVHVCQLRKVVGDRLRSHPGGYQLDVAGHDDVDAVDFTQRIRRARQAADHAVAAREYGVALSRWRGDAMDDVVRAGMATGAAQILDRQRTRAVEEWVAAELLGPDVGTLVGPLTELIDRFPLDERLRAALMIALDRQGQDAAALTVFDEFTDVLAARLGADPGEELRAAAASIRRRTAPDTVDAPRSAPSWPVPVSLDGDVATRPMPIRQLPPDLADFVERPALAQVLALSHGSSPGPIVVCIVGPAGAGKTAIAVHAAHRLYGQVPGAQLHTELRSSSGAPTPVDICVGRFLRALGVTPSQVPADHEEATALYRSLVASRRMLVLVDDAATEEQVRPLLPTGPGSIALVTSRHRLGGLSGAHTVVVDTLSATEAEQMLRRIVGDDRVDADRAAAIDLLARCDHLALAVRAAGARLATRPGWRIAELLERLDTAASLLDHLRAGDIDVRRTMTSALAAVAPADRHLLRRLTGHPHLEFAVSEAVALAGDSETWTRDGLDRLVDAHLLVMTATGDPATVRYRLPSLLRAAAADAAATGRRHRDRPAPAGSPARLDAGARP